MAPAPGTSGEILGDLLKGAIPVNPTHAEYVTRGEFTAKVETLESKITSEALRTKLWVALGCLSIIIAGIGGYVSLVSKLDRLNEALPIITERQNNRWPWVQQLQQRELMQDEALKKLDKTYQPLPYQAPPQ